MVNELEEASSKECICFRESIHPYACINIADFLWIGIGILSCKLIVTRAASKAFADLSPLRWNTRVIKRCLRILLHIPW